MHPDQAWPVASDFCRGGGFYELTLRLRNLLLWGGACTIAAGGCLAGLAPEDPLKWIGLLFAIGLAPGMVAWSVAPANGRLGHPAQCRIEFSGRPATPRQPGNLVNPRKEPMDLLAVGLVLMLAWAGGPFNNLGLLLLFSPLIVFRLCSRLWTELDLVAGRVYHHRTFMGLQITRQGANLEQAVGLVSGLKLNRPGEDPVYAVYAVMPDQEPLELDTMCLTREESHNLGRRLSLQLNLLHDPLDYEPDPSSLRGDRNFRGRPRWKTLKFQKAPRGDRAKLPPGAEDPS
ncbi:hypothetical protein JST97_16375 [bacterium]|nr:hypothetical protein [bacterium]